MHPATEIVVARLRELGAPADVRVLDSAARTAAEAAVQLGVPLGAIASSLVFLADDEPLLVMTSGAHRVDTRYLAGQLGIAAVRRADPDSVRRHTGQPIGGVAPTGHPAPIRTVVDIALAAHPVVWAAAGHPHTVFPITFDLLVAITGGQSMAVTADG